MNSKPWRRWALFLLLISVLAPLLSIGMLLGFYLKDEIENRRTIAFMNFEQQAYRIKEMLRDEARSHLDRIDGQWQLRFSREPRALILRGSKQWETVFGQLNPGEIVVLQKSEPSADIEILKIQGQLLIAAPILVSQLTTFADQQLQPGNYVGIWNLDANLLPRNLPSDSRRLYLINQQSSLIYSSVAEDAEEMILKQPLVQEFIKSPLSRAGTPLRTTKDGAQFGFYMAVPDSNLTLFVESSAAVFFAPLMIPTTIALGILLGILGLTIMIWRSALAALKDEVQRLSQSLDEFSKGYLIPTQLTPQSYLLELRPLVESINKNTRGVRDRVDLMEKQKNSLLFLLSLVLGDIAHAESRLFVSLKRSGEIWIMPPLGSSWQRLKTDSFDEGSLLRLMPGASIEFKQTGRDLTAAEIEGRLRVAEPMVLRIDRHIFKELRYKDYGLDGIWNEGPSQEKEANVKPMLSFAAAYVRHLLSLDTAQELPKLKADPEKSSLESAEKINNLIVLAPGQDSLHFIDGKTTEIPVYWQSEDDNLSFRIHLWPAGDVKREALATVKGSRYLLTIRKVGSYRLQITSTDHRYRSPVLRLNVDRPLAEVQAEDPLTKQFAKAKIAVTSLLQFQYPPKDLEIMATGAKAECLFVWDDRQGLHAGDEYRLVVQGEKKDEYLKVATQIPYAKLRLPPGTYHYFVMKQNRLTTGTPQASGSQQLRVVSPSTRTAWQQLGRKAHEVLRDSTVLLELR